MLCLGASARGKQPVAFSKVPQIVQDTVLNHYLMEDVLLSTRQKTQPRHYMYEFRTADGTKMLYTDKAVLIEASNKAGIQHSFLPAKVLNYVLEVFPNAVITEYERSSMKQEVELNNDIELVFNKHGKFLRIDD